MADGEPIYHSDAQMRPDGDFEPAALDCLVVGNRGRLLDSRRTPVTVVGVAPDRGAFVVRVEAFEDSGATWELFLGELDRFQFERNGLRASRGTVKELTKSLAQFNRPLVIECSPERRQESHRELLRRRGLVRERFGSRLDLEAAELESSIARREGDARLYGLADELLDEHGLRGLERDLLGPLVSNPRAGEMVKGHAIVLAELGFCPYRGRVVRAPDLFDGERSTEVRAEHLLWRMALTQELWACVETYAIFRAVASDDGLIPAGQSSFVSATFSRAVAESHFKGGQSTRAAVLMRQELPVDRLVITFLETLAMNERFREAEALLIGTHAGPAF